MPASDQLIQEDHYQLVPRTLIFLTCAEHVLMVKGAAHKKLWPNLYNGLGGHVEKGEDIFGAARRELFEESGLVVEALTLAGVITVDTGDNPGVGIFVFRGDMRVEDHQAMPRIKPSDEGSIEWVPLESVLGLHLVDDLHSLLPVVMDMQTGDEPFSARYEYDEGGHQKIYCNHG